MLHYNYQPLLLLLLKVFHDIHPQIGASYFTGFLLFPPYNLSKDILLNINTYFASYYECYQQSLCCKPLDVSEFDSIAQWCCLFVCLTLFKIQTTHYLQKSSLMNTCLKIYVYVNVPVTKRDPSLTVQAGIQSKNWFEIVIPVILLPQLQENYWVITSWHRCRGIITIISLGK